MCDGDSASFIVIFHVDNNVNAREDTSVFISLIFCIIITIIIQTIIRCTMSTLKAETEAPVMSEHGSRYHCLTKHSVLRQRLNVSSVGESLILSGKLFQVLSAEVIKGLFAKHSGNMRLLKHVLVSSA